MNTHLSTDYAADQLLWPNIVRALGMALIMTPLSGLAMVGIAREDAGNASGLLQYDAQSWRRGPGRAILVTFLTKREQYHSAIINSHVNATDPATATRLQNLQQYFLSHGVSDAATSLTESDGRHRRRHPRPGDAAGLRRHLRAARRGFGCLRAVCRWRFLRPSTGACRRRTLGKITLKKVSRERAMSPARFFDEIIDHARIGQCRGVTKIAESHSRRSCARCDA